MLKRILIGLATLSTLTPGFLLAQAPSAFKSGFYEIKSGLYSECCGFIAVPFVVELPDERQRFIELIVDPGGNTARLTFLGPDLRTVVSNYPWTDETFPFSFSNGVVRADSIQFGEGDPRPPGEQADWLYVVRGHAEGITVNGVMVALVPANDVPTDFEHTNVVATLLPNPVVIDRIERDSDSMRFHFTGRALYDYWVEYSDSLTTPNWQVQAGYRAKVLPIDLVVTNSLSAAQMRYFRIRYEFCNCR